MNRSEFLQMLENKGYPEPVLVEWEPHGSLGEHTHPFEVKALVTYGQIDIAIDGIQKSYSVGDVFHLSCNQSHSENYGEQGVKYLASRKEPS